MFSAGLLILTQPPKSLVPKLKGFLRDASQRVRKTLYIKLEGGPNPVKPSGPCQHLCQLVPHIYWQASQHCSHLDVRVLQTFSAHIPDHHIQGKFQVVLSDSALNLTSYLKDQFNVDASKLAIHSATSSSELETVGDVGMPFKDSAPKKYEWVCMGGTFDRIHNGHKVLLSEAINLCSQKLVIGVTDISMIKNKTLSELIEPVEKRISCLKEFLQEVQPALSYVLEPIADPFGPAITLPQLQCIVVSQETRRGGDAVNQKRLERGMLPLHVHEIELVQDGQRESPSEEFKVSSSSLRRRCLGTYLRQPQEPPSLPKLPYLIGLTGGIASGKSSIGQRLQALGAGHVDCDRLAHLSYSPGTQTHASLVQEFGKEILSPDGIIDRKQLGTVVFGNEEKRQRLNAIVWPAVATLVQEKAQQLYATGHKVVVLEAALLLEANWQEGVHQVWVSTIPEKEAVVRIVSRDGLSEEAALLRIRSQMSNNERVSQAHVVFSTLWEHQETQKQVEKAWNSLKEYLDKQNICRL